MSWKYCLFWSSNGGTTVRYVMDLVIDAEWSAVTLSQSIHAPWAHAWVGLAGVWFCAGGTLFPSRAD